MTAPLSRRTFLQAGSAAAAASLLPSGIARAATAGTLQDIEHVVILMNENRSFDHYFGTYPGVRGFDDPTAIPGVFEQHFPARKSSPTPRVLSPFHLDTAKTPAMCTPDITHGYDAQHTAWDQGAMDKWGVAHAGDDDDTCMGYYTRADLPYFYAVADTFTLCDNYHCSVLGSTTSNRLYAMTGELGQSFGHPITSTQKLTDQIQTGGTLPEAWKTFPEVLSEARVSWKSYSEIDGNEEDNPLYLFRQYWPENYQPGSDAFNKAVGLQANMQTVFPADFLADCAAGTLPSVSWITEGIVQSEHPSGSPADGESMLSVVINALVANPLLWSKVALFVTYDENGGYFDHICPPTAPPGTPGEYVAGLPVGLGYRVPMMIVSPYSQGGFVARDVFDHTSIIKFIERRFGVHCPNLSQWRRDTVGDLTSAFNFADPKTAVTDVPAALIATPAPPTNFAQHPECATEEAFANGNDQTKSLAAYPTPSDIPVPHQEPGSRPSPSGLGLGPTLPELPLPTLGAAAAAAAIGGIAYLRNRRAAPTNNQR